MSLTLAEVEALAPDQSSLAAAGKSLKPATWTLMACDLDRTLVWGEAQGSGSAPYRLCFVPADRGYKCSCPSRKFPCKHVLALMWQWVERPGSFALGASPPWVADWLTRRRPGAGTAPRGDTPPRSLSLVEIPQADPEAEIQAAARRAKSQAARTAGATEALDALDTWLLDQLHEGLATFPQRAKTACRAAAQRLVDGKAAGLAMMIDELPTTLFGLPEPQRPDFIATELGRIHLAAAAFRRQEALPALREDAKRSVGWMQTREELLADPAARRIGGTWTAVGARVVVQVDRLRRVETWLAAEDGEQAAVLIDYAPVATPVAPAFASGERFEAELAFYPSAAPLRAIVAQRVPGSTQCHGPVARRSLPAAVAAHLARLGALPWLGDDMLLVADARLQAASGGLWLTDAEGTAALPLPARQGDTARPLLGLPLHAAALVWDSRVAELMAADTPLGPWFDAR